MTSHINPVDEQATEATSKLTLGVIGLGAMGSKLLEATIGHADFDVAVAADSNAASRASASTLISGLRTVASADEVLTDPSIDAVYIATPPESHATLTLAALAQGKHVFCEKPLTIQLDQGQAMVEAAKESGKICAVNFALSDRNSIIHLELKHPGWRTWRAARRRNPPAVSAVAPRIPKSRWLARRARAGRLYPRGTLPFHLFDTTHAGHSGC